MEPTADFPPAPARYAIEAFRDRGGAGSVYRAWDRGLGRCVALKFLRDDRPEYRARMLREARAQARVEHPHVCQIFDVGEEGDRLYIAMQWIEGERLDVIAPRLTLEEKIAVIRDVAGAVHAAHADGVIHRDLKPANILVEVRENGELHPYVVDFGLARAIDDAGTTATGEIIGTPQYLSPEQAWGLPADRRSDVYSLGATLYELLAGVPPFSGESATDVVMQVISRPVRAVRRVVPSVPRDLAVIVETCLAKEPERRYDSARALRDDLERWLSGEPIAARAPGIVYRTRALLRRHRAVAGAVALATLVTGTAAAARIVALQRERAEREAVAGLEDRVRYVERLIEHDRALPLHDTRPAIARAVREIARLRADPSTRRFPRASAYAEGRARLTSDDALTARRLLEQAWNDGFRSPAVGYHLGVALSGEYARALVDAERIQQKELREIRLRELRDRFRRAAIPPLSAARGYAEQPAAMIEARIAFLEGDDARTIALTKNVLGRFPWSNDARLLQAEAQLRAGRSLRVAGRYREARAKFREAQSVYEAARLTAPSDIRVLDGLCQTAERLLQLTSDAGGDQEPWFEGAKRACEESLVADPEHVSSLVALSSAWTRIAYYRLSPRSDMQKAIEIAERALRLAPQDPAVLIQVGAAYYWMPLEHAPKVAESMRRAVALDPSSADAQHNLGRALLRLVELHKVRGEDPRPVIEEAIRVYREVLRLVPDYVPAANNLGYALAHRADDAMRRNEDARPFYREMLEVLEPRIAANPEVASLRHLGGIAWAGVATIQHDRGEEPTEAIRNAERLQREAIRINPGYINAHHTLLGAHLLEARIARDDATRARALRAADEDIERMKAQGISVFSFDWYALHIAATPDPAAALRYLERAESDLSEWARRHHLQGGEEWILRGRLERIRCRVAPSRCDLSKAEKYFQRAVEVSPGARRHVEMVRTLD